jgi:drug/metabolite transporter (DMT)-like permease
MILHYFMLVLLAVIWGTSFAAIKIGVETIPPVSLAAARILMAALVLYAFVLVRGLALPRDWRTWIYCFWIGVFGNALPFSLIGWGEVRIDSGLTAILMAVMPLATLVLAHLFTADERMNGPRIIGVLLGLGGVGVLIGADVLAGLGDDVWRQLAVAGGAVCYAIGTIITRLMPHSDPSERSAAVMICASLQMVPFAFLLEDPLAIVPSASSLVALAYLGIVATAVAAIVYFVLIAARGATFFSYINYLIPIVGVAWGLTFLDEQLSSQSVIALGLILAGITIADRWTPTSPGTSQTPPAEDRNR